MARVNDCTNLASEFYVLSTLYRVGLEPVLTLGNKKYVDIILSSGKNILTIDVKGLRDKSCWLFGNEFPFIESNHYYVLVSFIRKINDVSTTPESYIVPSSTLKEFIRPSKKGFVVDYSRIRNSGEQHRENWQMFVREMSKSNQGRKE